MEKISAEAESERSGESQARGWVRVRRPHTLKLRLAQRPMLRRAHTRLPTRPAR